MLAAMTANRAAVILAWEGMRHRKRRCSQEGRTMSIPLPKLRQVHVMPALHKRRGSELANTVSADQRVGPKVTNIWRPGAVESVSAVDGPC